MSDEVFSMTTRIARPATEVFAWHERPGALERLTPPWERVEIVAAADNVKDGARVEVRSGLGPLSVAWEVAHRDYVAGEQFRDVQLRGPFARWEHTHRFEPDGPEACRLTDEITYRLPGGGLGRALGSAWVRRRLERMFAWRHATTKADVESRARYGAIAPKRIAIAGASGLIGRALIPFLRTQGHTVLRLVRREARAADEIAWNPAAGAVDANALAKVEAIVNLAGENVAGGRWTAARREAIRASRVEATRTLVAAIKELSRPPTVLVNASATGIYGDRGDEVVEEGSSAGPGFLAKVCRAWEAEAERANALGVRTTCLRFGVVLTPAGGALGKMLPVFRAGLGGRLGSGRQWMSWVGIDDVLGAIHHAIVTEALAGPVNIVAPQPVTNAEFTCVLAKVLRRPAVVPVPRVVLQAAFGEMAEDTVLASVRAVPGRLAESGYAFRHVALDAALRHVLGR